MCTRSIRCWLVTATLTAACGLFAVSAGAQEDSRTPGEGAAGDAAALSSDALLWRRHTVAELEAGVIVLPTAPISGHPGGNTPLIGTIGKGDATLQTGVRLLFRPFRDFAVGAGALFAPLPTTDSEYGGASGLQREHARSYLQLNGEVRYIPIHLRSFEVWVGGTLGAVIVADRFTTDSSEDVPPILGTRQVTVDTEGLSIGAQAGAEWLFAERVVAGIGFRMDRWFLPMAAACSSIGDCATLTGHVTALEMVLKIGYRLPL